MKSHRTSSLTDAEIHPAWKSYTLFFFSSSPCTHPSHICNSTGGTSRTSQQGLSLSQLNATKLVPAPPQTSHKIQGYESLHKGLSSCTWFIFKWHIWMQVSHVIAELMLLFLYLGLCQRVLYQLYRKILYCSGQTMGNWVKIESAACSSSSFNRVLNMPGLA